MNGTNLSLVFMTIAHDQMDTEESFEIDLSREFALLGLFTFCRPKKKNIYITSKCERKEEGLLTIVQGHLLLSQSFSLLSLG